MNEFRWFCVVVTSLQIAFVFTIFLLQVQLFISLLGFIFWYTTGLIHSGVNKSQAQVFVSKFVTLTNAKATKGNQRQPKATTEIACSTGSCGSIKA